MTSSKKRNTYYSTSNRPVFLVLLLCVLSACSTTPQQISKPVIHKGDFSLAQQFLHQYVRHQITHNHISGVSVSAVMLMDSKQSDAEVLRWNDNFGFAEKGMDGGGVIAVDQNTIFRAGSLAKVVNAIAILRLQEKGLIELNDAVTQYLPELNINSRFDDQNVTIKQLLTHQSGLPSDWISGMWRQSPDDYHGVIQYLNEVFVSQAPDTVFQYSNVAHDVLAIIIEKITKQSYSRFIQSEVFNPLNMTRSSLTESPDRAGTAKSYQKDRPVNELGTRDVPAAGLNTTAKDHANLMTMLMDQGKHAGVQYLSPESIALLMQDHTSAHPLNVGERYGLSLHYYEDVFATKYIVVGHDGATPGQRALFKFSPQLGIGVVVLSNSRDASPVLHRIANQTLQTLYQVKVGGRIPYPYVHKAQAATQDITDDHALKGYYATRLGLAQIYMKHDQLYARFMGKTFNLVRDKNSDLLFLDYKFLGLVDIDLGYYGRLGLSVRQIHDRYYLIGTTTLQQKMLVGERITPSFIPAAWKRRVGHYKVVNPLQAMKLPEGGIKIQEGFLIAHAKTAEGQELEFVLQALNDDEAVVAGVGRGLGETVFAVDTKKQEETETIRDERVRDAITQSQELLKFADIYFKKTVRRPEFLKHKP